MGGAPGRRHPRLRRRLQDRQDGPDVFVRRSRPQALSTYQTVVDKDPLRRRRSGQQRSPSPILTPQVSVSVTAESGCSSAFIQSLLQAAL